MKEKNLTTKQKRDRRWKIKRRRLRRAKTGMSAASLENDHAVEASHLNVWLCGLGVGSLWINQQSLSCDRLCSFDTPREIEPHPCSVNSLRNGAAITSRFEPCSCERLAAQLSEPV